MLDPAPDPHQYARRGDVWTWDHAPLAPGASDDATFAAAPAGDGKTASFVLYSGREVRPGWSGQVGGDVIRTREFRLQAYRLNPVVLADHNPTQVIGRGTAKIVSDGDTDRLEGSVVWDLADDNPVAITIAGQHARGMRQAVSIGFSPGAGSTPRTKLEVSDPWRIDGEKVPEWRAGVLIRNAELLEWSSVAVPRDRGALQLQADVRRFALETEDPDAQLRRVLGELLDQRLRGVVLAAVRSDPEIRAAVQATALLAPPAPPVHPPPQSIAAWFGA